MKDLEISRPRLAEYLKMHADVLAAKADVDIDVETVRGMDGTQIFIATARVEFRDIPINELEVQAKSDTKIK